MEHKHTNRLIKETSPYLLQHAHNPVNWYPWGEEALQKAQAEDKPILISIGYSACHWCHVMERESFEDEATAEIMNMLYVNIKIDREERPDLDHIYMDAVQAIAGSGGWPLNVFLTPDKKPFYGGTYFPPVPSYNRSSWKDLLVNVHRMFSEKRHEVEAQAENLTAHLLTTNSFGTKGTQGDALFTHENLVLIADNLLKQADTIEGGFGGAPKFPQTFSIQFLLRHYHFAKDDKALKQALLSLDKMANGGIYDQIGGGFARYSTDKEWLVPHFEKMLYDNALLIGVFAEAYQLTKNSLYANKINQTLAFIERELTSEEGGFYSALDADSEGVEGKFYVWDKHEIEDVLGEASTIYCEYYDVSTNGNWEEVNILNVKVPLEEFASARGINENELSDLLESSNKLLLEARSRRVSPNLDDKILLGWNALMITAYCKAYAAIGDESYKNTAEQAILFLESKLKKTDHSFYHTYKHGEAKIDAFLDDYAYLIQCYIHLQEITGRVSYLGSAKDLTEFVLKNFRGSEDDFLNFTHNDQADIIIQKKEVYDGATPSGNSIMVGNLLYLSLVFDNGAWRELAINSILVLGKMVLRYPTSFGSWAASFQLITNGIKEIVLTGKDISNEFKALLKKYIPNKILQSTTMEVAKYPLLANKFVGNECLFYLCEDYACLQPFNSLNELMNAI
jgi:uncharacterized protein YyaL (SSP411 family)